MRAADVRAAIRVGSHGNEWLGQTT
jgi:hypothetical protein